LDSIYKQISKQAAEKSKNKKQKRLPKPKSIRPLQSEYLRFLLSMLAEMKAAVDKEVVPYLNSYLESSKRLMNSDSVSFKNDSYSDEIAIAMTKAKILGTKNFGIDVIRSLLTKHGLKVSDQSIKTFSDQFKAVTNVEISFKNAPWLFDELKAYTKTNVDYITSIQNTYFSQIEETILRDVQAGKLASDTAKDIFKRYEVSKSRAKLIAQDQTSKFYSSITAIQQKEVGVEKYQWSTSLDERVRPLHAEREGQTYYWNDPPSDGNPGFPIRCRCVALPIFPGFEL
jgi:SPP1 gp7 family putative phage head morphogenesis protein